MKRRVTPWLGSVRRVAQFGSLAFALVFGACGDAQRSQADANAAGCGSAASSGTSGEALGGAGDAGRSDDETPDDALSGAAGERASAGTSATGGASHSGGSGATAGARAVAGAGAVAGTGAVTGSGGSNPLLGEFCESDSDCGTGLTCLQASSGELDGGGPAHGMCTRRCTSNMACEKLEPGAACRSYGSDSFCFEACTPGDVADLASKCHGRTDFACARIDDASAFCLPVCRADVECGAGRFCNRAKGLCQATQAEGDPVGTPCDPTPTTTATCLGSCLRVSGDGVTSAMGVCVELCSGGLGCMYDDAGTKPGGLCLGQLSAPFGVLDFGYCLPSCDCSGECPTTFGTRCRAWTSNEAAIQAALGKAGLCYDSTEGSQELTCQ